MSKKYFLVLATAVSLAGCSNPINNPKDNILEIYDLEQRIEIIVRENYIDENKRGCIKRREDYITAQSKPVKTIIYYDSDDDCGVNTPLILSKFEYDTQGRVTNEVVHFRPSKRFNPGEEISIYRINYMYDTQGKVAYVRITESEGKTGFGKRLEGLTIQITDAEDRVIKTFRNCEIFYTAPPNCPMSVFPK